MARDNHHGGWQVTSRRLDTTTLLLRNVGRGSQGRGTAGGHQPTVEAGSLILGSMTQTEGYPLSKSVPHPGMLFKPGVCEPQITPRPGPGTWTIGRAQVWGCLAPSCSLISGREKRETQIKQFSGCIRGLGGTWPLQSHQLPLRSQKVRPHCSQVTRETLSLPRSMDRSEWARVSRR